MNTSIPARSKHNFEVPEGTQEVFRQLLDAIANPGKSVDISNQVFKFESNGLYLGLALTLLDNESSFYFDGSTDLGEEIRFLSGAAEVPLEKADFVFLTIKDENVKANATNVFSRLKSGTHLDPHNSAMLFVAAGGDVEHSVNLKGPGIPPLGRETALSSLEMFWLRARDLQGFEYPCGVELIFLREDNTILAITRKAAVTWPT